VITPDSPDRQYSTRLRTALVLTGVGTAGAYHAGVLRALHEAGIRVDVVAGRGIGALSAMFAAVDGGSRLWDNDGMWKSATAAQGYGWRTPLKVAGWAMVAAAVLLATPLLLLAGGVIVGLVGLMFWSVSLTGVAGALRSTYGRWLDALFDPASLPTVIPRLVVLCVLVAIVTLGVSLSLAFLRSPARRRVGPGRVWRLLGSALSSEDLLDRALDGLWSLIRGAAPLAAPPRAELGRKYLELLTENLGQPGFRELLLISHDMDARRDVLFALLTDPDRSRFFGRPVADGPRQVEAFDFAGVGRDHAMDALAASLSLPVATDPHLIRFSAEGPWRGETHRLCDRPGAIGRLLEEVRVAGADQVIVVSAAPPTAHAHELSSGRADLKGRAGEQLQSFEVADLRDAIEYGSGRFAGLFIVRPNHNPLGPLDFGGVFDERSDRRYTLAELVDRGYEDAYRQFVEPVVAASGERIATVQS
jgi:hypothetical protein